MKRLVVVFALAGFFSGCMVGPKYKKPQAKLPDRFAEDKKERAIAQLAQWWTFFHDEDLNSLIKKAIEKNYDLRGALEKIEQMRAAFKIKEAELYPEVDASGSATRSKLSKNLIESSLFPKDKISYFGFGFNASWEIDFWGKLRHAKKAAYANYQAQVESMRDVYLMVLSNVARAYIDCRALQKKIDILDEQIVVTKKLLDAARDRLAAGVANEFNVLEEKAVLNQAQRDKLEMQTALQQTINGLALLLGENPEDFSLAPGCHEVPISQQELTVGLPSDLLRRRPDIRQAEYQLMAATENIGQAVAQYFPSFSLLGDVNIESNKAATFLSSKSFDWTIGPAVHLPILTFGRIKFQVEEAKSIKKQAFLVYGRAVVAALEDVENALVAYFNSMRQVTELKAKVTALATERDLTNELFACGLANISDALQAQKNYLTVLQQLTDVQQAMSSALILVYKSLGGGWETCTKSH